ncbi:hypothetical protein ACTJKN_22500 [Pedobacter sp. 22163]|uniref:hypothetical protein n=1 Tax=Pedobacter sp. 22163 TaxID=3453883 RepID=UPI003F83C861
MRKIAIMMVILSYCHPYFSGIANYSLLQFIDTFVTNGDKGVTFVNQSSRKKVIKKWKNVFSIKKGN